MKPEYGQDLVVAIINKGTFDWYILVKEMCYLDNYKWADMFRRGGSKNIVVDGAERYGIPLLDETTVDAFLEAAKERKTTTELLRQQFFEEQDEDEKLSYMPSVLIDFDERVLINCYAEPEMFQWYVPDHWVGIYEDFDARIPKKHVFWEEKEQ